MGVKEEEEELNAKKAAGTITPNEDNRRFQLQRLREYNENRTGRGGLGSQMPGAEPGTIVGYDFNVFSP
ncbi:MAG TPA: hypothetical protein VMD74_02545 [Candidatus Methylomirabilis sp.]|nr:hypothetical protein [Candidatus Methylomirabilis sp.]